MTINFQPISSQDKNYARVIDLFFEAFPKVQSLPPWVMKYRMRNGKPGFNILYEQKTWVGFIYIKKYKDIVFVKFLAVSEQLRSGGYGSKIMDAMKNKYSGQRIVLNIEELDKNEDNYQQRVKRKGFYQKNGFYSTGYLVKEPAERQEMLIYGGVITKEEINEMYKHFLGSVLYALLRPEVQKI